MIFVDTNVIRYAVGRSHPLRKEARRFFLSAMARGPQHRRVFGITACPTSSSRPLEGCLES